MGFGRTSKPLMWLRGHTNKIWDLASNKEGSRLASASGDGTVRLWALPSNVALAQGEAGGSDDSDIQPIGTSLATLTGHQSDVYSVAFHPDQSHVVTGGHDRVVRLYDVRAVKELKSFAGHEAGVLQATTNAHGNLLVSGSRDGTVRFWDVLSGVCVRTLTQPLGAVTSVQVSRDGLYLLTSSRHGSVRLWDLRIGSDERPLQRFRGHQNTSSSFLRATFAAEESLILGGSDCGALHVWDRKNGDLMQKLKGHSGAAYRGTWSDKQSMAASCGEDGTVRTWWWQDQLQETDDSACACAAADTQPLYEASQEQRQEQGVELPAELSAEASAEPQPSAADPCSAEQSAA
eukprot:TRINITY_DN514_c0_g1_i1.p1 TRINITY_DN514_c0_g1~~TRINITY_DN514_c0_g1_i1.p1  ORF type:complete len:358 (-),score=94.31 TRINITY_DN514_c0_g1_i1:266-1306(-)